MMNTVFSRANARRPETSDSVSVISAVRIYRWLLLLLMLPPEIALAQPLVRPNNVRVNEGEVVSITVVLASVPMSTAIFEFDPFFSPFATAEPASLTFTTTDWHDSQTVKLTFVEDNDDMNDFFWVGGSLTFEGGTKSAYDMLLNVQIIDNDTDKPALRFTPQSLAVDEGGSSIYRVRLSSQPSDTVTVLITGQSGTDLTLDKISLTFTTENWDTDQMVKVSAGQDLDRDEDVVTLRHAASGGGYTVVRGNVLVMVTDKAFPTVEISGVPDRINSTDPFTAAFTFSEAVTGFETGDITINGGTKGAFAGSGTSYTLAVTPDGSADVTVTVNANSATNGDGNTGPASAQTATATWDATRPTMAITGVPAKINSTSAFTATFTFSEAVTGFVTGDVTVIGGTKGALAGSGTIYTLAMTPTSGSNVVVTVAADAATNGLNTGPAAAVSATATWDNTAPTVAITGVPARINSAAPFTATFTFSEVVTGFVTGDVAVTGGTKGAFAGSGISYTLAVTPDGSADVVVTVAADAATDGLNTGPTTAVTATATWDAPPTVEINDVPPRINSTTPFTAEFVFSEAVTGFVTGDIAISGGTKGAFAGSGTTYTLAVTPSGSADVVVLVAAEAAIDVDGNTGPTSEVSATATWDAPPTVEINDVPPRINSTTPFTAEFVFSEAVTDFEIGDVTVTGGTKGTFTATNATTYTLDVTPNGSADVVVTVAANSAADGINTGPASAVSATTIWDATPPTVKVSGIPARINSRTPLTAIFMFSEAVTGFEIDDITMSGGNRGTFTAANATTYTLDVTPNGSEDVVVTVAANAATDGLNTGPASAVTEMAIWDPAALTVTINDVPFKINSTNPFSATFTFSEIVTGFMTQDVTITGGTKGTLSGSGRTYTLAVIPNSGSNVAVTVAANSVTNGLNTGPASAVSATAIWDAIPPTVEISGLPPRINTTTVLSVTFTFSETVTGFNDNDITVSGGTKGTFTATNATTYTLDVTPNGSEDVVVTAAANAATDGLNTGPPSVVTETAIWDAAALSVTINDVPLKINAIDPFIAEFVFSEAVMEFVTGDVTVTGGTKGTFAGSGTTYTLVVTPSGFEDVVVTVAANAATDGLKTGPASAVSEMAIWDATAPTLTIGGVPSRINTTTVLSVTFTFSEAVTVFNDNDITVSGGTKGTFTATNATTYTLAVTPDGSVDVVVTVAADAATDGLNTGPPSAVTATAAWGGAAPTVTIEDASATEGDAMTFTVTLDEAVSGGLKVTPGFTDGTATKGLDYTENTAALTFAGTAGETQTFTVATTEDLLVEDDETFTVDLMVSGTTAMVSATDTGTGTIADNEAPGLVVKPDALSLREGASESFTVALSAAPLTDVMVTITGHAGSDLTLDRELL
ncbi:MAG: Ig-like domain-containing protein, partial [Bacteroidota bacterium]|nr:Ig-like domain-containing protein [Bacteroidota bacterium]